jgi:hypothetical protein
MIGHLSVVSGPGFSWGERRIPILFVILNEARPMPSGVKDLLFVRTVEEYVSKTLPSLTGLGSSSQRFPALKRWAKLCCAYGVGFSLVRFCSQTDNACNRH